MRRTRLRDIDMTNDFLSQPFLQRLVSPQPHKEKTEAHRGACVTARRTPGRGC
jgi:hypothetical protein